MQQERMHEDDVAGCRRILQHLYRDAVNHLDALEEALDAPSWLGALTEVPQVRVAMDRLS